MSLSPSSMPNTQETTHSDAESDSSNSSSSAASTVVVLSIASSVACSDSGSDSNSSVMVRVLPTPSTPAGSTVTEATATATAQRTWTWRITNYVVIPACLPLFAAYWALALLVGVAASWMVWPSLLLAQRLYWACPFIPHIWRSPALRSKFGVVGSWLLRLQFEGAHCTTVISRLLTLPMRPHLPDFYLLGFPKCGTTSMAAYLKDHPGISGLAGMPGNETFAKESHFFGGILGRSAASSSLIYRSFFPTFLTRWWAEAVCGVPRWMCFDACPTSACLPYVAARAKAITPNAKLVVMVRDPVAGVFSAETMLRGMGVPLTWSLADPLSTTTTTASASSMPGDSDAAAMEEGVDPRFKFSSLHEEFWRQLESLPVDAPLPAELPTCFYFHLHSYLQSGRFADRLQPWIKAFGRDRLLLVDFKEFCDQPEATVRKVLDFVGADSSRYTFKPQSAPRMANDYKGSRVDAGVADYLRRVWFADSTALLEHMMMQQEQQQKQQQKPDDDVSSSKQQDAEKQAA